VIYFEHAQARTRQLRDFRWQYRNANFIARFLLVEYPHPQPLSEPAAIAPQLL